MRTKLNTCADLNTYAGFVQVGAFDWQRVEILADEMEASSEGTIKFKLYHGQLVATYPPHAHRGFVLTKFGSDGSGGGPSNAAR